MSALVASLCIKCTLPECDERSRRCRIRHAKSLADKKRRDGIADQITPEEHAASNEMFNIWKVEKLATISEARRA